METKKVKPIIWKLNRAYCGSQAIGSIDWEQGHNPNKAVSRFASDDAEFPTEEEAIAWVESQFHNFISDISQ